MKLRTRDIAGIPGIIVKWEHEAYVTMADVSDDISLVDFFNRYASPAIEAIMNVFDDKKHNDEDVERLGVMKMERQDNGTLKISQRIGVIDQEATAMKVKAFLGV